MTCMEMSSQRGSRNSMSGGIISAGLYATMPQSVCKVNKVSEGGGGSQNAQSVVMTPSTGTAITLSTVLMESARNVWF